MHALCDVYVFVCAKVPLQPRGWITALAAPRETVVEQLWRQDENGVYLVMLHSKDHPAVPVTEAPWYSWFAPVRAQVSYALPWVVQVSHQSLGCGTA